MIPTLHRHTPLEACIGTVWGLDPFAAPLPEGTTATPRTAIERALARCLAQPPCIVSFSGGRDSSAVLAIAARVARDEGLPLPIPATNRFPSASESNENEWQESVVTHLGLEDWIRLDWTHELDMLGPYGIGVLRRHGPVMPFNAHFLEPLLAEAAGGSLLTGIGGDELITVGGRPLMTRLLFRARRPRRGQLAKLVLEAAPRQLRVEARLRDLPVLAFRWLRPDVRRHIAREYAHHLAEWPVRWDRSVAMLWRSRHVQCVRSTLDALSAAHGATIGSPFLDPEVLAAYARSEGPSGPSGRGSALIQLVGDLLPEAVLRRKTKATFDDAFFNRHSRDFVREWSGAGVDRRLVDDRALLAEWSSDSPSPSSYTLLQHAWLNT